MTTPRPGQRLVIRYGADGQTTDALGTVAAADDQRIIMDTGRGRVEIPVAAIEVVHEMPPAPTQPGRLHRVVSPEDLRRISAAVWLPADAVWLNADNLRAEASESASDVQSGWLLRAAHGVSQRANSALPLTAPGIEPAEALDIAQRWYADRSLPPAVQIFSTVEGALAPSCEPLGAIFRERGFAPSGPTLALTADAKEAAGAAEVPAGLAIVVSDDAHRPHFDAWGRPADGEGSEGHADFAALIRSPERFTIVSAIAEHPDGSKSLVGTVRLAIAQKWGVVSNLVIDEALRRRGAGRALVQAAASLAARQGVRSLMAEVEGANAPSLGLFSQLGFAEHHRYWFARRS